MLHVQPRQFRVPVVALGSQRICFEGHESSNQTNFVMLPVSPEIELLEHAESYFGLWFAKRCTTSAEGQKEQIGCYRAKIEPETAE
jgi:hypothetical protein